MRERHQTFILFPPVRMLLPARYHLNPIFCPGAPSPDASPALPPPPEPAACSSGGGGTTSCLITNKENPFGCSSVGGRTLRSGHGSLAHSLACCRFPARSSCRNPHLLVPLSRSCRFTFAIHTVSMQRNMELIPTFPSEAADKQPPISVSSSIILFRGLFLF